MPGVRLNVRVKLATDYHIRYENTRTHAGRSISLTLDPPKRDDRDGCDGFLRAGRCPNIVTVVTAVMGAGSNVKGIPVGGDCRKAIQPEPLDIWPTEDTVGW